MDWLAEPSLATESPGIRLLMIWSALYGEYRQRIKQLFGQSAHSLFRPRAINFSSTTPALWAKRCRCMNRTCRIFQSEGGILLEISIPKSVLISDATRFRFWKESFEHFFSSVLLDLRIEQASRAKPSNDKTQFSNASSIKWVRSSESSSPSANSKARSMSSRFFFRISNELCSSQSGQYPNTPKTE